MRLNMDAWNVADFDAEVEFKSFLMGAAFYGLIAEIRNRKTEDLDEIIDQIALVSKTAGCGMMSVVDDEVATISFMKLMVDVFESMVKHPDDSSDINDLVELIQAKTGPCN